jgi:hypothetical protein
MKIRKNLIFVVLSALFLLCLISASGAIVNQTVKANANQSSLNYQSATLSSGTLSISPMANVASLSNAVISAVQSGTTSTSSITLGPSPNPIGTDVSIDIRIDNAGPIWGWTLPTVTWNPQVLNLTQVQEGPFLTDNTGGGSTFFAGNSKQLWDNTHGLIEGGLTDALSIEGTSVESSGVLATLTFLVTGTGTSQITIAGGNLRANSTDSVGVNVTCDSATIIVTLNGVSSTSSPAPGTSSSANPTSTPPATTTTTPTPTGLAKTASVPEFPAWVILPIFVMTLLAVLGYRLNKKKLRQQHNLTRVSSHTRVK